MVHFANRTPRAGQNLLLLCIANLNCFQRPRDDAVFEDKTQGARRYSGERVFPRKRYHRASGSPRSEHKACYLATCCRNFHILAFFPFLLVFLLSDKGIIRPLIRYRSSESSYIYSDYGASNTKRAGDFVGIRGGGAFSKLD